MRIKTPGKIVILLIVVGLVFGILRGTGYMDKLLPGAKGSASSVPPLAQLPDVKSSLTGTNVSFTMPGNEGGCTDKPEVRMLGYAWNAQMGLHFANGGAQAAQGSLMCKYGVNFKWDRQDNNDKLAEGLVAFATALSRGEANPKDGVHFVTIMGDGGAAFLKGLNDTLGKIGPEYRAKIVGAAGYSRGEDKFMGPAEWKSNPLASRGGVVAGVIRDGDWNIAMKWLADNGLKNNPDEKTYDPDALNWVNASDYLDAPAKYVAGYTESRPVVRNGKRTGETKQIKVDAVVTWTPGDVNVAKDKGGLVSIVSTKQYASQMPCVIIGIDKWMKQNPDVVKGMLHAIADGGDAVRSSDLALQKAAEVSAAVYKEKNSGADYWLKYYKGTIEPDKTGQQVELGGSSANNLADMELAFGITQGSQSLVAATYRAFGDVDVNQYPDIVPSYYPAEQVIDSSYVAALAKEASVPQEAIRKSTPNFSNTSKSEVISKRKWNIQFETGRAAFTPSAMQSLERMRRDLLVASGAAIEIHGHTDNQGDPQKNMQLSESRAFAVKSWLEKSAPTNFPEGRISVFAHGQTNPVASNASSEGRAQNRRVEIWLVSTK